MPISKTCLDLAIFGLMASDHQIAIIPFKRTIEDLERIAHHDQELADELWAEYDDFFYRVIDGEFAHEDCFFKISPPNCPRDITDPDSGHATFHMRGPGFYLDGSTGEISSWDNNLDVQE